MALRHSDVPLIKDASERFLPWLVAFMVYLAALALVSAVILNKTVRRWDGGLSGELTVEVPPPAAAADPEGQSERIERVLDILIKTRGVTGAAQLQADRLRELLEPWLGTGALDEELPLPALIAVTIDPERPPDLGSLAVRLKRAVPGTVVDDHQRWLGNLLDLARSVRLVAVTVVGLIAVMAVLAIVVVTRTGLSVHSRSIELLHLIGARDAYIARQFQRHALKLGLRGGLLGAVMALATILPVGYLLRRTESALLPEAVLSLQEWAAFAALPLVAALVAMATARITVLRTLDRMP